MSATQGIVLALEFVHLLFGVLWIPARRINRGGNLIGSYLLGWALYILWAVTWCMALPMLVVVMGLDDDLVKLFPEPYGVTGIVLLGWLSSTIGCTIMWLLLKVTDRFKSRPDTETP